MNDEPKYYNNNGLSPLKAFKKGLLSREEYIGFLKGNIIKYVVRAEYKEDAITDLDKASDYLNYYKELLGQEKNNDNYQFNTSTLSGGSTIIGNLVKENKKKG